MIALPEWKGGLSFSLRSDMYLRARFRDSKGGRRAPRVPPRSQILPAPVMSAGLLLSEVTGEIALFAAAGGLLFALDDLLVDLIYFVRAGWRSLTVYSRYPRAFAAALAAPERPGRLVVLIPAWDEAAVIGDMLRATLERFEHDDYRLYVGHYRNDPSTAAAIARVVDPRIRPVEVPVDGPTTTADCLNCLYGIM